MAEDLDKKIAEDKAAASKVKTEEELKAEETKKKEEHLANLNKAIAEANAVLRKTRAAADESKGGKPEEDDLPQVDLNDPSSKAWDRHFNGKINPLQAEIAKEKEEVRTFALRKFLSDKPNLAKDQDAIKRVMDTYERIKNSSERTQEGVLLDLDRAYAAEFHNEIRAADGARRIAEAQGDAIFSDPAVSRSENSFKSEREKNPHLTKDDEAILARWGLTPSEWVEMKKKQDKTTA